VSDEHGWASFNLSINKAGLEYLSCKWIGGDKCSVSEELVRSNGPYMRGSLFGNVIYVGPYKLNVIRYDDGIRGFYCYRNPNSFHNRLMPRIFPVYVRCVEFVRWIFSKHFLRWLESIIVGGYLDAP
jgi:hypothetical protein